MKAIIILSLLALAACSYPESEPAAPPVAETDPLPAWLIGSFQSHWFPESTNLTVITQEAFHINMIDLQIPNLQYPLVYDLTANDYSSDGDERHVTLHLADSINITFRKVDDPSSNSITIEINERHFGLFKKM